MFPHLLLTCLEPTHVEQEAKKAKNWHVEIHTNVLVLLVWVKVLPREQSHNEVGVDNQCRYLERNLLPWFS